MSKEERQLSTFERAVLEKLLDGNDPILTALRAQLDSCEVTSRDFTGVGFYTNLKVDRSAEPAPTSRRRMLVLNVGADISGLDRGASLMVFVTNGYLDCLEGFAYDEPWPPTISEFSLHYEGKRTEDPSVDAVRELADL